MVLRFNSYKSDIPRIPHSEYTPLLIKTSLAERKKIIDLIFPYKIINSLINCPDLLSFLYFNVPYFQTRSTKSFHIPFPRTNYALVSPINRLMKIANDVQVHLFNFQTFNGFYNYITHYTGVTVFRQIDSSPLSPWPFPGKGYISNFHKKKN